MEMKEWICEEVPALTMDGEVVSTMLHQEQELIRCKDCKHRPKEPNLETYESGLDLEFPEGSKCPCRCNEDEWYSWYPDDDWFCADGQRKTDNG